MFTKGKKGNKALISFLNAFLADTYGTINTASILNTELTRDMANEVMLTVTEEEKQIARELSEYKSIDGSRRTSRGASRRTKRRFGRRT